MSAVAAIRTARKPHKCAYGQHDIQPGERYWDEVYSPWTLIHDDPDGGSPLGTWEHVRFHGACQADVFYA